MTRRRRVVAATSLAGSTLLGLSLSSPPGSRRFYALTGGVAATWVAGGLASGPVPLGDRRIALPVATGACAFGAFYAGALVARRIPFLNRALRHVLGYAHQGSSPPVLLTTLATGAAEEVFFRGALYAAAEDRPVRASTAAYALSTTATRNPALVLASVVMGTLFGFQRRASGGVLAPAVTHVVWSALMVRFLPPLFSEQLRQDVEDGLPRSSAG
ncbi:CPBP family intramembrane glutamic endopeptidase [Amycolatopsis minnesotensis]|uniref:CPBP family intramembrane metalloprotease n=1 Tax=Amycolatopsis minnesotensis TaxID=337894 RepID=A0ABN2R080_9PSEU